MSSQTANKEEQMDEEKYYLVLTGTIIDGNAQGEVVAALEHLLQMPRVTAYSLLQGKRSRIRKALTKKKADRLQAKLVDAGAGCFIEPVNRESESAVRRTSAQEETLMPMDAAEMAGSCPAEVPDSEPTPPASIERLQSSPQQPSVLDGDEVNERLSLDLTPGETPSDESLLSEPSEMRVLSLELEPLAEAVSREMRAQSENDTARAMDAAEGGGQDSEAVGARTPVGAAVPAVSEDPGHFFEQPSLQRQPVNEKGTGTALSGNRIYVVVGALLVLAAVVWAAAGFLAGGDESPEEARKGLALAETGPPADPQLAQTEERMRSLGRSVKVWMIQYGFGFDPHQVTLSRVQGDLQLSQASMQDGWGTPLGYQPQDGGYWVLSAGPDRTFATPDDLKETVSLE